MPATVRAPRASFALLLLVLLATLPQPALAYLDPGAGSMILQVVLGGIAGLAVGFRLFWHKLAGVFGRKRPVEPEEVTNEPPVDPGQAT